MYSAQYINTMKVVDLRKLVAEHSIFKGGLSSMKKHDIVDKIYQSQWWQNQSNDDLIKKQQLQKRLEELEKLKEKSTEPNVEPVEPVVEKVEPIEKVEPVVEKPDIDIDKLIQDALDKQRTDLMVRLFG